MLKQNMPNWTKKRDSQRHGSKKWRKQSVLILSNVRSSHNSSHPWCRPVGGASTGASGESSVIKVRPILHVTGYARESQNKTGCQRCKRA